MKNTFNLRKGDKLILKKELEDDFFAQKPKKHFTYGIIDDMRNTLKNTNNIITVKNVINDTVVAIKEDVFRYDVRWFDKYDDITPKISSIGILFDNNTTTVTYNGQTGIAKRNSNDIPNTKIGIVIATMRALQFPKFQIDKVIDVLFNQTQTKEDILNNLTLQDLVTTLNRIANE